ncbi:MAG: hypothetical protein Q4C77_00450 [Eubacteriales bacterium]|nr:hypothetical protein [Eubacteriales bacterium]
MEEKKQKLVIDGNAIYELDLECLKKKTERETRKKAEKYEGKWKRQRD